MQNTLKKHEGDCSKKTPPIKAVAVLDKDNIEIKISDQGPIIDQQDIKNAFEHKLNSDVKHHDQMIFGHGMPMIRLQTKYLDGDFVLSSIKNQGTDAHLYLRTKPNWAQELLPLYNQNTRRLYENPVLYNKLFGAYSYTSTIHDNRWRNVSSFVNHS